MVGMNRREFLRRSAAAGTMAHVSTSHARPIAPSDRVTVGVLGSGARAQQIVDEIVTIPGVEVVAVCDAYTGRAQRARERTGGRAQIHHHYKEILDRRDVDTVLIGSPDHWHREMAIDAVEAGKDVYIEKPLTYSIDEGLEIIDAVKRTNRMLMVGSQGISSATQQKARQLIKEGRLGKITMIRASYNRNTASGAWLYPIPPDASPRTVDWKQFLGRAPHHPFSLERFFRWRCYRDYSGGIATDLFVHLVTTIHYVTGAKMPRSAMASGQLYRWKESRDVPDTINAIMVYPEGFTANLSSTFNNQSSAESGFEILGTEGTLSFRGSSLVFTPESAHEDNRWVVRSWTRELEDAYYTDPKVQKVESPETWASSMSQGSETWHGEGKSATYNHFVNFLESVKSRKQPVENALIGHRSAACAHLINTSAEREAMVSWDFEKERMKA